MRRRRWKVEYPAKNVRRCQGFVKNMSKPSTLIALQDIPVDTLVEVEAEFEGERQSLILHHDGERVRAWRNLCPHAGRRLDWAPGKFLRSPEGLLVCAVHGASFELVDGVCTAGPCRGQPLQAVPVSICDGQVRLGRQAA